MLFSFLAAATWIPAVLGFGSWLRLRTDRDFGLAIQGFAGLAVLSTIALLAHFWVAIGPAVSWTLFATGALAFIRDWRASGRELSKSALARCTTGLLAAAAFAQLPERQYDSGLYYLQAVAWTTEEPFVRGLANLHFRLGFNSSWFAAAAAMEHGLLAGKSSFFLNILPVFFVGSAVYRAARSLLDGDRSFATLFLVLGAVPVVLALESLGGLGQDQPVMLVGYAVVALSIRAMTSPDNASGHLAAALVLAVWAATIKLSAAPLPLFVLTLAVARRSEALRYLVPAAVLAVPWAVRGVLLSGCIVFPAAVTCIPGLPWGVPRPLAAHVAALVRDWARAPGPERAALPDGWMVAWLWRSARRLVPLAAALTLGLAIAAWRRPAADRRAFAVTWGAAVAGTLYWFATAPDVRFGLVYLFPLAFLPVAYGLSSSGVSRAHARKGLTAVALAGVALGVAQLALLPRPWSDGFAFARWPELPSPRWAPRMTASGVTVHVPVTGDQCWATPRPCTPAALFTPELARDAGGYRTTSPGFARRAR